jgi:hypothetical protein
MRNKIFIALVFVLSIFFIQCSKNDSTTGKATLSISLTDDPGNFDEVNIDIVGVEVTGENGAIADLNVKAGIYNLLDFTNGIDTLIATGSIDEGTISQIRLILGDNNTVVVDGVTYSLSTPSAQESGLKLQVHDELKAGVVYAILLDFDANKSIVEEGNGSFQLKPVIQVVDLAISGSIKGAITPVGINCAVAGSMDTVVHTTYCDANGQFLLQGLPAGIYQVTLTPDSPFVAVTINGVNVSVGEVTDLGVIAF